MRLATIQSPADWRRPDARQRVLGIALTLGAELLFLLLLLAFGASSWLPPQPKSQTTDVVFLPEPPAERPPAPSPAAKAKPAAPPKPHAVVIPPTPLAKSPYLKLTSEEFAAADISKLGSAGGHGKTADAGSSASVGVGPGGSTLYNAEWFRRPSHAELAYYLPKTGIDRGSWAEVACKTIADNHVENCQAIGESPPGSGLARAIREAAWQFRIRPPRVDGKPLTGTWVKVHIDFTEPAGE